MGRTQITKGHYDAMTAAWYERQSVTYVAQKTGHSVHTVYRYVFGPGNPKLGYDPIIDRWVKTIRKTNDAADRDYAKAMGEWQQIVRALKAKVAHAIKAGVLDEDRMMQMTPVQIGNLISRAIRDESFALGGPDSRVAGVDLESLTDDQLRRIAEGEAVGSVAEGQ
jgi:hypothetical protein